MGWLGILTTPFRRLGADIERDSREWMIRCTHCGHERSVWSAGGIRYKAFGVKHTVGFCSRCGQMRILKIYHPARST